MFSQYHDIVTNNSHAGQTKAPQFKSYPLCDMTKIFDKLWTEDPTVINTSEVLNCQPEGKLSFEGIPFRVTTHMHDTQTLYHSTNLFLLHPTTTFIFQKQDINRTWYFVEYCQWIQNHQAYLKVSGLTAKEEKVSPTDLLFPLFVFVIPACLIGWILIKSAMQDFIIDKLCSNVHVNSNGKKAPCTICSDNTLQSSFLDASFY